MKKRTGSTGEHVEQETEYGYRYDIIQYWDINLIGVAVQLASYSVIGLGKTRFFLMSVQV